MTNEPKKEVVIIVDRKARRFFMAGVVCALVFVASFGYGFYKMQQWDKLYTLAIACTFSESCTIDANLKITRVLKDKNIKKKAKGGP